MTEMRMLVTAMVSIGMALCLAAGEQPGGVGPPFAEMQKASRRDHAPSYEEPKTDYYPTRKDHQAPQGGYEYRRDVYDEDGPDRHVPAMHGSHKHEYTRDSYEKPEGRDYQEYQQKPSAYPPADDTFVNELTPSGEWPRHLKLRLFGKPVGHVMNMSLVQSGSGNDERHGAETKMYDTWCEVTKDPAEGQAVAVPHVGHFHIVYAPAHVQKPWRLFGQTALRIGRINNFTLARLDDDNDVSICATFFNNKTVITPVNSPTIYNMLVKPKYPVNMQYVLDMMRDYPISLKAATYSDASAAQDSYPVKADKSETTAVMHHVVDEATECKIVQLIWGQVSITTQVNGETLKYDGTLFAVPDFDTSTNTAGHRMETSTERSKIIQAMCGDKAVREAVPWVWEFDLKRA